jgi:hypothetical protein
METVRLGVITTLLFCLSILYGSAQGSLQFNQAKLISTIETVPVGKVWKVENVAGGRVLQFKAISSSDSDFNPAQSEIKINGISVSTIQAVGTGAGHGSGSTGVRAAFTYAASPTGFPLWLPEGTTLEASTNIAFISVIEFNIVP